MRLCVDFEQIKEQIYPGPYAVNDSGIAVATIADNRPNVGSEVRDIQPHGHGFYTDNHRALTVTLLQPARAVEITTWLACDLELLDPTGAVIYATNVPASVREARFESAQVETIGWLRLTAISEFMLLSLCIES
jgi:hypothetical protein